jgi:hypothetical protein
MRRVALLAMATVGVVAATAPAEAQQTLRECLIRNIANTSPACHAAAKVKRDADRLRSPTPAPK